MENIKNRTKHKAMKKHDVREKYTLYKCARTYMKQ